MSYTTFHRSYGLRSNATCQPRKERSAPCLTAPSCSARLPHLSSFFPRSSKAGEARCSPADLQSCAKGHRRNADFPAPASYRKVNPPFPGSPPVL